jgi:hypothetical protein
MPVTESQRNLALRLSKQDFIDGLDLLPEALRNHRRDNEIRVYADRYQGISNRQKAARVWRDIGAARIDAAVDVDGVLNFIIAVHGGVPSDATIRNALAE